MTRHHDLRTGLIAGRRAVMRAEEVARVRRDIGLQQLDDLGEITIPEDEMRIQCDLVGWAIWIGVCAGCAWLTWKIATGGAL